MGVDTHSTRRTFVKVLGALGATFGLTGTSTAQEEVVETIELIGYTGGWEGVSPESIAGEQNPTIRFEEAGARYRINWENGDGLRHNFVIRDEGGNNLVGTDLLTSEGQTASVEFEATEEMTTYLCEPHSGTMNGDIAFGQPDPYKEFKQEVDVGLEATSDGWVGLAPPEIEGETNPTIQLTEGQEYEFGIVRSVARDDIGLSIVDEDGNSLESTGVLNDHNLEERMTVEATTEMVEYLASAEPDVFRGDVEVEPTVDDRETVIQELTEEADYVFDGITSGWEGLAPESIEGQTNPAIELEEGESYVFGFINGDGAEHNIAIWDEDDEELSASGYVSEENGSQTLEFEATAEAASYVCDVHPTSMAGELTVTDSDRQAAIQELTEEADYVFDGLTPGWEGLAPGGIEGETNPALELEAGESYVFGFVNGDGAEHNIAIWDSDDEELHASEHIDEENATASVEFEATTEAATYVCDIHPTTMVGDLSIQGGDGNGGGGGDDDGGNGDGSADDGGAGFGIVTTLTAIGAGGAAAARRLLGDDPES